jgi:hypothetical protein
MWKIKYKPIKICHVENSLIRKNFNLNVTGSFFHAFTHVLQKTKRKKKLTLKMKVYTKP